MISEETTNVTFPLAIEPIMRWLRIIQEPRDPLEPFEIRAPDCLPPSGKGKSFVVSSYHRDYEEGARAVIEIDRRYKPPGIYATINPCKPELFYRSGGKLIEGPKHTTTDKEIARRRWLFFDLDSNRPAGIAASDEELQRACRFTADLEDNLSGILPINPVIQGSGNGFYLYYGAEMPNDDKTTTLIKKIFAAAIERTKDLAEFHQTHIDTSVFNAARIARIGGTVNRKGTDSPERPWRLSELFPTEGEIACK